MSFKKGHIGWNKGKGKVIPPHKCEMCDSVFIPKTHSGTRQYCGYACSGRALGIKIKGRADVKRTCMECKGEFTRTKSIFNQKKGKYCSRDCFYKAIGNTSIKLWKPKAWGMFSLYIKKRDGWTCITCGAIKKDKSMHAGHFVPAVHQNTMFNERNVHAQCSRCNLWGNGEPHLYAIKLIEMYGIEEINSLTSQGKINKELKYQDLKQIYDQYKSLALTISKT